MKRFRDIQKNPVVPHSRVMTCDRRQVVKTLLALPFLAALPHVNGQTEQKRVALVVGNQDYKNGTLTNPINDATDLAKTLLVCGFAPENILLRTDRTFAQMAQDIRNFTAKLDANTIALFYFSGHGMQIEGRNYLLPIDFEQGSVLEMKKQAQDADGLLEGIPGSLRILILDACRDNPFVTDISIENSKGLNAMRAADSTLIAFSTAPGRTTSENPGERNSLYTRHLLQEMVRPGLSLTDVFYNVSSTVSVASQATGKVQGPWINFNHLPPFVFVEREKPKSVLKPAPLNPTSAKEILSLTGHDGVFFSVAFSPDGRQIVTGNSDRTAQVWDATTGEEILTLTGHRGYVVSVAFSPDGKRIVTGSTDHTAKIWDSATGKEIVTLKGHHEVVYSVASSPDGKRIVTGSGDRTAKVWDALTGKTILIMTEHSQQLASSLITAVAFSPDGKRIVTGSSGTTAKVRDITTGKTLLILKGHRAYIWSVAFSPNGKRIVTGSTDHTAKIWDATTGKTIFTLKGHRDPVYSVAFSLDGRYIATAGGWLDKAAKVWNATNGKELFTLSGHRGEILSVAFSPDGRYLVTGSEDKTVKVWELQ